MNNRVLFLTTNRKKDIYGITSGLFNSATFVVNYLNTQGFNAILIPVLDANQVDRVVTNFNPSIVIIEALWITPEKMRELLSIKRHQSRRWIVRIHSKAPFLANEGPATKLIAEYSSIDNGRIEIAPNTKELTKQLSYAIPYGKFIYLPNIYVKRSFERDILPEKDKFIDIGCFGAIRPMKNTFQQALAAIEFSEKNDKYLRFHINGTRMEQGGESVIKNLRSLFEKSPHKLIEHKWYTHSEFLKVVSKMDIGMQVSFSESFNIVTADMVTAGVPVVASNDIDWMPWISKVSPNSPNKIVRGLETHYHFGNFISKIQQFWLDLYSKKSESIWLFELNNL
jgi:hypothetical protein